MNMDVRGVFTRVMLFAALLALPLFASALTRWDNPLPQGFKLSGVAYNGQRYVAVGNGGTILYSATGADWQLAPTGSKLWLHAVTWSDGKFVAIGKAGVILTSADGITWARQNSHTTSYLYGIARGAGLYAVVGSGGAVLTSPDGIQWTPRSAGVDEWLNDVAWNGAEFIAVGSHGRIVASADGLHWEPRVSPVRVDNLDGTFNGPSLGGVTWAPFSAGAKWVVVSESTEGYAAVLTSEDGMVWTESSGGEQALHAVTWDPTQGLAVAVGAYGRVATSDDGITWVAGDTGRDETVEAVVPGTSGLVLVGDFGTIMRSGANASWQLQTSDVLQEMRAAATDGIGYVAVGNGLLIVNSSAETGAPTIIRQVQGQNVPDMRAVIHTGSGYIALGGTLLRSADGVSWTRDSDAGSSGLNALVETADHTLYAVGANGLIMRRPSGGIWQTVRNGGMPLRAIAADGAGIVAVGGVWNDAATNGPAGAIFTSRDGITWTETAVPGINLLGIASANGVRVAVGSGGSFLTFVNGAWTAGNMGTLSGMNAVTWTGTRFMAVGDLSSVYTSSDGLRWSSQTPIKGNKLNGVAASTRGYVTVGEGGTVIYNACPCANDDTATTPLGTAVVIPVLANDVGDGLLLSAVDGTSTHNGTIARNANGTLTYTPPTGFTGTDFFTYSIGSNLEPGANDSANVTVEVTARSADGGTPGGSPGGSNGGSNGGSRGGGGGGGSAGSLLLLVGLLAGRRLQDSRRR